MAQNKLRIGIVGGGGIVRAHLPQLTKRTDAVEVVAIADVNAQAAEATAQEYSIPRYSTDYREWLDEVDAVVIGIPTHLHHIVGIDAANAGKAIFMEKPMTRTREQADQLLEVVKKNGVPFQVGFVRRFDTDWLAWREAILESKIGRPVVWHDTSGHGGPPSKWFFQDEMGGGPFLDGCIHNYDFALFTFGKPQWAFAHLRSLRKENTAFDTGTATIHFESGDELMLAWSWGLPKGIGAGRIFEFLGSKGLLTSASLEGDALSSRGYVIKCGDHEEQIPVPEGSLTDAFAAQMDEFIAVAKGESTPRVGAAEGLESLRVALAVLESGRTGEVVKL